MGVLGALPLLTNKTNEDDTLIFIKIKKKKQNWVVLKTLFAKCNLSVQ